jgi:hypothetical protein
LVVIAEELHENILENMPTEPRLQTRNAYPNLLQYKVTGHSMFLFKNGTSFQHFTMQDHE